MGFRITHRKHRGSVLPRIATSRASAGGVRLRLSPLTFAEIFMLATMPLFILALIFLLLSGGDSRPWELVGGIISATAGFFVMLAYYDNKHRARLVSIAIRPWPLRLGSTATVRFSSPYRDATVAAKLLCVEEAAFSGGREQRNFFATRYESDIDTTPREWTIEVPEHEVPSLAVASNRVRWLLQATITSGEVVTPAEFELLVLPEIQR